MVAQGASLVCMRPLASLVAVVAALALAAPASAAPVSRSEIHKAQRVALDYWHATPCGGTRIAFGWGDYEPTNNAMSWWENRRSPNSLWRFPRLNRACEVDFNRNASWDWPKACTVMVHEYGHLLGHQHSDDPADVMFPSYRQPVEACA